MRAKDVDDSGFQDAAANCRKLESRKSDLTREYSDICHKRAINKASTATSRVTVEVANLLVGFNSEDAVPVDNSRDRLEVILREIDLLDKAIHEQEAICTELRLRVERQVREKALAGHKELAKRVIKHRQEGRQLRQAIHAFEAEALKNVPFGYPLEVLEDSSDELCHSPLDDSGATMSSQHEKRLADYIAGK